MEFGLFFGLIFSTVGYGLFLFIPELLAFWREFLNDFYYSRERGKVVYF